MILSSFLDNQTFQIIFWLSIFIIALAVELATNDLVSIWFSGGAIISLILAICKVDYVWQIVAFCITSGVLLIVSKLFIRKKLLLTKDTATNADSMIEHEIFIVADVTPEIPGQGRVRDVVWTCISGGESFRKGEFAIIKEISGNKLIIKKKED